MAEGRAVGGVYFGFTMAFNTVSQSIPIDKLMKYNLNKWAARWMENWQNCWAKRGSSLVEYPCLVLFLTPNSEQTGRWYKAGERSWYPGNSGRAATEDLKRLQKWAERVVRSSRKGNPKPSTWGATTCAPVQSGNLFCCTGEYGNPGGEQTDHEPAMHLCDKSPQHAGLH